MLAFVALAALLAGLVGVAMYLLKLQKEGSAAAASGAAAEHDGDGGGGVQPAAGRRGGAMDRMRAGRLRQRRAAAAAANADGDSDGGDSDDGGRREAREAERLAREAKAGRANQYEERRRKREEEREAAERAQEEEIRRAAEERRKREDAEAAKWMGAISVEDAGVEDEAAGDGGAGAAARIVAYIQARKMVAIDELATEFRLRSAEVVDRLQALEAQGALTGVMDERGKYIHISSEEMAAVAEFVKGRGRVAIAELAARSGELIDLEPKAAAAGGGGAGGGDDGGAIDFDALLEGEGEGA